MRPIDNKYLCCAKYQKNNRDNLPKAFDLYAKPVKINDFTVKYNKKVDYLRNISQLPEYFDNYEQYLESKKPK